MIEVRTPKGKLVGTIDSRTCTLHIKDGKKTTMIDIPDTGLKILYTSGTGEPEEVQIPPLAKKNHAA